MRNSKTIDRLEEIPGMSSYLSHAGGYGPGEICDKDGHADYFEGDDACAVIAEGEDKFAVMCQHDLELPQIIVFYLSKDKSGRIVNARRMDATENNMDLVQKYVEGKDISGMTLDKFPEGLTRAEFDKQLGIA